MQMPRLIPFVVAGISCHAAHAVLLPNPSSALLETGTSLAAEPSLRGIVVADTMTPFSRDWTTQDADCLRADFPDCPFFSGTTTITVQSQVLRSVDGTFDFYWRISNRSTLQDFGPRVFDFSLTSFSSPSPYNANWRNDLPGDQHPLFVSRDGSTVSWGFGDGIRDFGALRAGESSRYFFLDTDATAYGSSAFFTVGDSARYTTFAPIPEPMTYTLMLAGLGVMGFVTRRRRRQEARALSSGIDEKQA